jgi:hypothetical protein
MNDEPRTFVHYPSFNVHLSGKDYGVNDETNWDYCQTE